MALILFDGVCNLCNGFVQFVIRHDSEGRFRFAALQSAAGQAVLSTSIKLMKNMVQGLNQCWRNQNYMPILSLLFQYP